MLRLPRWLLVLLILVITGVWVASFVAGLFVKEYNPPESINLVFSAMVAALLAQLGRADKGGGEGDGS